MRTKIYADNGGVEDEPVCILDDLVQLSGPGRRTHNLLRTRFLSSLHRGRQSPNQDQPEEFVLLLASRATARELLLLNQGGPSDPCVPWDGRGGRSRLTTPGTSGSPPSGPSPPPCSCLSWPGRGERLCFQLLETRMPPGSLQRHGREAHPFQGGL